VITCAPEQVQHFPLPPPAPPRTGSTRRRTLAIGVIGPGRVGSALLEQLRTAQPRLARDSGLELKLCGVVASKRMWLDCDDAELNARNEGAQVWRPYDLDAFA
jgi:aspartokinase/homoserine dehydrogenase 1